ncbi:hypothetical protein C8D88_114187 [Lentzea atacamensis]|uniref:Uncharacterized protein n=1 Tax=Lentzea atacamensis TaxID=531938 RepID=A0A316HQC9_9PSEU|nr:hypothetical protein [Lentzea atacamensis]PWK82316.1 hypothetical protein C8D88_114187 [Lentzea atacamensis]
MSRATRLLAAASACATVLGMSATPALAAPAPEATAAAYVFTDGLVTEALVAENGEIGQPMHASGFTATHPGWDVRLSDEAAAPGLPKQDVRLRASQDATSSSAGNKGFLSIIDGHSSEVPLVVVNYVSGGVSCSPGGVWHSHAGQVRLWVRDLGHELYEVDWWNSEAKSLFNGGGPADRPYDGLISTTVKLNSLDKLDQLTGYGPFAKYQGRTHGGGKSLEVVITQTERGGATKTYRILAGASAATC